MQSNQLRYYYRNKEKILEELAKKELTNGHDKYEQDESGQWWCIRRRGRQRAILYVCEQCSRMFPNRRETRFCSKACFGISQSGNRRGERPCAWCQQPFIPRGRGNRQACCSLRCAYDLGNTKRGRSGERNPHWKGGRYQQPTGYIRVYVPGRGPMLEHRFVMESKLGRPLVRGENVHHLNGIRDDNRPENLELWVKKQPPGSREHEQQHCPTCSCFAN